MRSLKAATQWNHVEQTTSQKTNLQHQKALLENESHNADFQQSHWNHVELATPKKASLKRVDWLLYQQTQQAELQQKSSTQLTQKLPHQRTNQPLKQYQF